MGALAPPGSDDAAGVAAPPRPAEGPGTVDWPVQPAVGGDAPAEALLRGADLSGDRRVDGTGHGHRLTGDAGSPGAAGLLEVVDRDDHVRQAWTIRQWPMRVGRALDNDIVLTDAYLAAHHFSVEWSGDTLVLRTGETINGVTLEGRHLDGGVAVDLRADAEAIHLVAGRTRLRLRLAGARVAPEQAIGTIGVRQVRARSTLALAVLLLAATAFNAYLEADPLNFVRSLGTTLLATLGLAAVWCGAWALLSKTITRQAHFGWHLRVFLLGAVALLALTAVPGLVAFAFSWPWLTAFGFIATYAVGGAMIYGHLLGAEPVRPRLLRWVVASGVLTGVALTLWFNLQRTGRFGEELYMTHLFPPALRLAAPLPTGRFIEGLAPLRERLDRKAQEPAEGEAGGILAPAPGTDDDD